MKLADTVGDMLSDLAIRRLVAEYNQCVIRTKNLELYLDSMENKQNQKYFVLMTQLYTMYNYKEALLNHLKYCASKKEYKGMIKFKGDTVSFVSQ